MSQITLYLDDATQAMVEQAARASGMERLRGEDPRTKSARCIQNNTAASVTIPQAAVLSSSRPA